MIIYSGGYCQTIQGGKSVVEPVPDWQGTYVFMKIKTANAVDEKELFGETSNKVEEFYDMFDDS